MGRREKRRRPTRVEKIKGQPATRPAGKRSEDGSQTTEKTERERRREMSPETQELVAAYAKVMGWAPERVLPSGTSEEDAYFRKVYA